MPTGFKVLTDAITIEGLGKSFRLGTDGGRSVLRRLLGRDARETFWAIRDIDLSIGVGDVLGIIGRNGSGKSTLLKVLSRITRPTEGRFGVRGRVGSLLEVGTGFHPELTGRENIFLSGALLGLDPAAIRKQFDEIVAFAGTEPFLETPVKRYSSGMRVRLGFAVAAHLDPEILIVDEVLAVGDLAFQQKCLGKMDHLARGGRTVLLVSHQLANIEGLCNKGLLLDGGNVVHFGDARDSVAKYRESVSVRSHAAIAQREDRTGNGKVRVHSIVEIDADRKIDSPCDAAPAVCTSHAWEVVLEGHGNCDHLDFALIVHTQRGDRLVTLFSRWVGTTLRHTAPQTRFRIQVDDLPLVPGEYRIDTWLTVNEQVADYVEGALPLRIAETDRLGHGFTPDPVKHGHLWVPHRFIVES